MNDEKDTYYELDCEKQSKENENEKNTTNKNKSKREREFDKCPFEMIDTIAKTMSELKK